MDGPVIVNSVPVSYIKGEGEVVRVLFGVFVQYLIFFSIYIVFLSPVIVSKLFALKDLSLNVHFGTNYQLTMTQNGQTKQALKPTY